MDFTAPLFDRDGHPLRTPPGRLHDRWSARARNDIVPSKQRTGSNLFPRLSHRPRIGYNSPLASPEDLGMSVAEPLKTPLHAWHQAHGGRIVEFGGWAMPVQYSTIVEEHQAVRQRVGLFDISHMGRLRFQGSQALDWLERSTTNHVARLAVGQIQYSLMVNEAGYVLDDLLVYRLTEGYLVVCNASNRDKVVGQFGRLHDSFDATMTDLTLESAMIAVQGPKAIATLQRICDVPLDPIKYYHCQPAKVLGHDALVSRTGYTGEDGIEVIVPAAQAEPLWKALINTGEPFGILPCGLGARDTLRLEAAMCLYGHELTEEINPYAAGVGWAVKLNKGEFVGRKALKAFKANPGAVRIGLTLDGKRIARQGAAVSLNGRKVGSVTSGTFSPTLGHTLAIALVDPAALTDGTSLAVDVRGHVDPARVTALPFYRRPGS
jgi:aminomethyltransferase